MFRVRITGNYFHIAADANSRGIARIRLIGRPINLLQLSVVNVHAESLFYRVEIGSVAIRCELQRAFHSRRAIVHKLSRPPADYSQGLPYYTHLLARESALHTVTNDGMHVSIADLEEAIREAVDNQLESHLSAYNKAVYAPRGKNFKPVLLACALAQKNEQQWFFARDVMEPLRLITSIPYDTPAFVRHLKLFCEESRGCILERRGPPKKIQYRFIKPLVEPYIVLRGLADGLIKEAQLSRPSPSSTVPVQLSLLSFDVDLETKP